MHPTTHKKVVVRLRPLQLLAGFVDAQQLQTLGPWDLLTPAGQALPLVPHQVQALYFVSHFDRQEALAEPVLPSRGSARQPGLWVRVRCFERFTMEGILASDLLDLDAGVWLTPLWPECPWQRAFLPRANVQQLTAIEVVRPPRRRQASASQQIGLFHAETPTPQSLPEAP